MESSLQNHLIAALKRLDKAYQEVIKTQGYLQEAEKIKMLQELIKEQVRDENSCSSAR
ncbi:MAG: hypothetical protein N2578_00775 [Bdellovibrionaceae bacterium]|nr:hypothetical protein [Pseudobdellovibrionaceae bacterium]